MGKKKSKLERGNVTIISKGFNDISEKKREELHDYFDDMFKDIDKFNEDPDRYMDSKDFDDEEDCDFEDDSLLEFEKELGISQSIQKELEKPQKVEAEELLDPDLTSDVDYESENEEYITSSEDPYDFGWILQIPLIFDKDYQQVNILSNIKNAASFDLFEAMRDIGEFEYDFDNNDENFDDDELGDIITKFKNILLAFTHPTVMMDEAIFANEFIIGKLPIPNNIIISRIPHKFDGVDHEVNVYGLTFIDMDKLNDNINNLYSQLSEHKMAVRVTFKLIQLIRGWGFKNTDVEKYFSQYSSDISSASFADAVDYCRIYGENIFNDPDSVNANSINGYIDFIKKKNVRFVDFTSDKVTTSSKEFLNMLYDLLFNSDAEDDYDNSDLEEYDYSYTQSSNSSEETPGVRDDIEDEAKLVYSSGDEETSKPTLASTLDKLKIEIQDVDEMPDIEDVNEEPETPNDDEYVFMPGVGIVSK